MGIPNWTGESVTRVGKNKNRILDWMGCLERDLSLFNLPTEAQHWTLGAKKPGERFRRVEEAAEQYMKRWFVTVRRQG